ncbi:tumor necrosis factor receptor superfamily member 4 isoform X2 [Ornithorhynchus anatinus]|uniref:TNF receptor superfamily member 4 n=1 Tax=Ornithorhynchus anatinus TaxID=9258 RepID=A0A6I8NB43_ORNAN|nr:tumor necrosis factor receptor superfamily member 4 isoform X2 [Ornithorhynchus anatinus]
MDGRTRAGRRGPGAATCTAAVAFHLLLLFLLLLARPGSAEGLDCGAGKYPFGSKCCHDCPAGFEMLERCNNKRDSKCVPCREGFFNEAMNYYKCKPCSWCYTDTGSQKSENCTATKDTVCHCSEGTQPRMNGRGPSGTECVPCPPAYYSPGENRICRPWTNCTAEGKQTLRAGTSKADAICEGQRPSRAPLPLISRHSQTTATQVRGLLSTGPQPTSQHPLESTQELLPLVLVGLTVLVVSGLITLLLTIYVSRRREERPPPEFGRQEVKSFRVPVQEQTDAHSSLVKN